MPDVRKIGFLGRKMGFQWTKLRSAKQEEPSMRRALRAWCYKKSYFPELGLMFDDIRHSTPEVEEALRRIPPQVFDERTFRIDRALQLSARKTVLPKEEWMTLEQDTFYLTPVLKQIEQEQKEAKEWERK